MCSTACGLNNSNYSNLTAHFNSSGNAFSISLTISKSQIENDQVPVLEMSANTSKAFPQVEMEVGSCLPFPLEMEVYFQLPLPSARRGKSGLTGWDSIHCKAELGSIHYHDQASSLSSCVASQDKETLQVISRDLKPLKDLVTGIDLISVTKIEGGV